MTQNETELLDLLDGIIERNHQDNNQNGRSSEFFQKNPDLFRISPRPGGFLKLLVPTRSQDFMAVSERISTKQNCPEVLCKANIYKPMSDYSSTSSGIAARKSDHCKKSVRISVPVSCSEIIEESESSITKSITKSISTSTYEYLDDRSSYPVGLNIEFRVNGSEIHQQSMEMLAVTISCVMQMAAKFDVPSETLMCAETYLQCMKDKRGIYPRNISAILSQIRKRPNYKLRSSDKENVVLINEEGSRSSIGSSIFSNSVTPDQNHSKTSCKSEKNIDFHGNYLQ